MMKLLNILKGNILSVVVKEDNEETDPPPLRYINHLVEVYKFITNTWIQQGSTLIGTDSLGEFGVGVSLNSLGDIMAAVS